MGPQDTIDLLRAELRDVKAMVSTLLMMQAGQASLKASDAIALTLLLPTLAAGIGQKGRCFTTADALAALDAEHPDRRRELAAALGGGDTSKRLGRLLRRAIGQPIGDLRLQRIDEADGHAVALWKVDRVSEGFLNAETRLSG